MNKTLQQSISKLDTISETLFFLKSEFFFTVMPCSSEENTASVFRVKESRVKTAEVVGKLRETRE
jgi:hypothetical protein